MATAFQNVFLSSFTENGEFEEQQKNPHRLEISRQCENVVLAFYADDVRASTFNINHETEYARLGKQGIVFTNEQSSILVTFPTVHTMKTFQHRLKQLKDGLKSVFSERTDEASAVQYFQFYGYLSQQQNMMQDYIRTATYQRAMLANIQDFQDKVVLDVGAGSGILSFFALQAGAKKVYAIEASSMAQHCELLVKKNNLSGRIIVIPGKVEEVDLPEQVDTIISEPMGYMLFNERMLESFLHAKKWLKSGGKMLPTQGDLHITPFTDESLFMEQYSKANFWQQESFYGIDLTSLRTSAVNEYFKQPVVDTFDMRICLAKSNKYQVDFQTAEEGDLHVIEIPLTFSMLQTGVVHGLAFWFEVAFQGTDNTIWLSTSPTEPLTHWYQVRCLVETPVFVKQGQTLKGKVILRCNNRQSYDVDVELNIPGTTAKSKNTLDLKNPFFRYTGQSPQPPPGTNTQSPSEAYWNAYATGHSNQYVNGLINGSGTDDSAQALNQGSVQVAPVNPGSIPSVISLVSSNSNANRTSIGGGLSPINFSTSNPSIVAAGASSNFPISNQFMIGDYVTPGIVISTSQVQKSGYM